MWNGGGMVEDEERSSLFGGFDDPDSEHDDQRGSRTGTTGRQWLLLAAGFVALAACVLIAIVAIRASFDSETEGNPVAWREALQDGTTVTVTWDASPCAKEGTVSVEETSDTVEITVREVPRQALCSSAAEVRTTTVELEQPVGERQLVDGSVD